MKDILLVMEGGGSKISQAELTNIVGWIDVQGSRNITLHHSQNTKSHDSEM